MSATLDNLASSFPEKIVTYLLSKTRDRWTLVPYRRAGAGQKGAVKARISYESWKPGGGALVTLRQADAICRDDGRQGWSAAPRRAESWTRSTRRRSITSMETRSHNCRLYRSYRSQKTKGDTMIAAPRTAWQLVVRAGGHCPAQLAACSVTTAPYVHQPTSWCVDAGSLAITRAGLSYTRRTIVEPRWAYTEHVEVRWSVVYALLHQVLASQVLQTLRTAYLEHDQLEHELERQMSAAAERWARPGAAARTADTDRARHRLIDHTRTILSPLVQTALTTAVPDHLEEDVDLLTDTAPIPYAVVIPPPVPGLEPAAELMSDLCWVSAGQPLTPQALVDGLISLGWRKQAVA